MTNQLFVNSNMRLIGVQFNFSNSAIIPPTIEQRRKESVVEQKERKNRPNDGRMVIKPIDSVSIQYLINDLEELGYELVDGFSQERPHPKRRDMTYFTTRSVFVKSDHATISEEFSSVRTSVRFDLIKICNDAFWRTTAFVNPFYENGHQVTGVKSANLNFSARTPIFNPDGTPLLARHKDEDGRRIGDPVPLVAQHKMIRGKKMLQIIS